MSSNDDIIDIEPIDISNIDNSKPASNPTTPKSVNFGPGIELLMNDKIKSDKTIRNNKALRNQYWEWLKLVIKKALRI